MIAVSEIVYVESVNHRLEIVTTSGRIEIPYKTCNSLLKELDSDNFVLCKRGECVPPAALLPDYHRLSQAERERAEREKTEGKQNEV